MDFELMLNSLPKLLYATLITIELLISSLIAGLILAVILSIMRISKNKFSVSYCTAVLRFFDKLGSNSNGMRAKLSRYRYLFESIFDVLYQDQSVTTPIA